MLRISTVKAEALCPALGAHLRRDLATISGEVHGPGVGPSCNRGVVAGSRPQSRTGSDRGARARSGLRLARALVSTVVKQTLYMADAIIQALKPSLKLGRQLVRRSILVLESPGHFLRETTFQGMLLGPVIVKEDRGQMNKIGMINGKGPVCLSELL